MFNKKAIFICGSGGSGKSTFSKKYFSDYTHLDMDIIYEDLLIKSGLNLKIKNFNPIEKLKAAELFELSKTINDLKFKKSISKNENIIIDSIGRDSNIIMEQRSLLEKIGYTTYMIMLYADLEDCLNRIELRDRTYDQNITIDSWYLSYSNLTTYKKEFGNRFILVFNESLNFNWKSKFEIFINNNRRKNTIL